MFERDGVGGLHADEQDEQSRRLEPERHDERSADSSEYHGDSDPV